MFYAILSRLNLVFCFLPPWDELRVLHSFQGTNFLRFESFRIKTICYCKIDGFIRKAGRLLYLIALYFQTYVEPVCPCAPFLCFLPAKWANTASEKCNHKPECKKRGVSVVFSRLQGFLWSSWWDSFVSVSINATQEVWSVLAER